jgi:ParB/Sulfiredoxin domain
MDGFVGRPQAFLGPAITVSLSEIANEPHRSDSRTEDLEEALLAGDRFVPPLVSRTPSGRLQLLGGERRCLAAKVARFDKIKVYVASDYLGLVSWLKLDENEPGQRPFTTTELGRFGLKVVSQLNLNGRQLSTVDEVICEVYGHDKADLQNSRQLVKRINSTPPGEAREALLADAADVDAGRLRVSSALSRETLRRQKARARDMAVPADVQEKTMDRAVPTLRGTVQGLTDLGPISAEVNPAARQAFVKDVGKLVQALARITRQIKELGESE